MKESLLDERNLDLTEGSVRGPLCEVEADAAHVISSLSLPPFARASLIWPTRSVISCKLKPSVFSGPVTGTIPYHLVSETTASKRKRLTTRSQQCTKKER